MTNASIAQSIIQSDSVRGYFLDYLRSRRNTWQRGDALAGLRAAIFMAVGFPRTVELIAGRRRRDLCVSIDGRAPVRVAFYIA